MKQLFPDLWQTPRETRFGTLNSYAYLLKFAARQDLIYPAEAPSTHDALNMAGGVEHIYLSHNHEISPGLFSTRDALGAKLVGDQHMLPYLPKGDGLDLPLEGNMTTLPGGFEAHYTPGHTDNNICYIYRSPYGKTYLFTGDTLYLDHGEWRVLVMQKDGGSAADLHASLQILRGIEADVVIPSVSIGEVWHTTPSRDDWLNVIDDLSDSLAS